MRGWDRGSWGKASAAGGLKRLRKQLGRKRGWARQVACAVSMAPGPLPAQLSLGKTSWALSKQCLWPPVQRQGCLGAHDSQRASLAEHQLRLGQSWLSCHALQRPGLLTSGGASWRCGCGLEEGRRKGAGSTLDGDSGIAVTHLGFQGTRNSRTPIYVPGQAAPTATQESPTPRGASESVGNALFAATGTDAALATSQLSWKCQLEC